MIVDPSEILLLPFLLQTHHHLLLRILLMSLPFLLHALDQMTEVVVDNTIEQAKPSDSSRKFADEIAETLVDSMTSVVAVVVNNARKERPEDQIDSRKDSQNIRILSMRELRDTQSFQSTVEELEKRVVDSLSNGRDGKIGDDCRIGILENSTRHIDSCLLLVHHLTPSLNLVERADAYTEVVLVDHTPPQTIARESTRHSPSAFQAISSIEETRLLVPDLLLKFEASALRADRDFRNLSAGRWRAVGGDGCRTTVARWWKGWKRRRRIVRKCRVDLTNRKSTTNQLEDR